jgi:hypothetical protein
MKLVNILFAFCLIIFCSCSTEPYKDYIGLWEGNVESLWDGKMKTKVLEISQNGESYLVNEDILNKNKPILLSKKDGQFVLDTGIGTIPFAFGQNKNILLVSDRSYKRITHERVEEIKLEINKEKEKEAQKEVLCKTIINELNVETSKIDKQQDIDWKEKSELRDALYKKYQDQAKQQGCSLLSFPLR